jgi:hypothetical protein
MMVHLENGRLYVSAEPCHFGMIEVPDREEFVPHLRRIEFQPYPWHKRKMTKQLERNPL